MKLKKLVLLFLVALAIGAFPTLAYAVDNESVPVEKVNVNFLRMDENGNWINAESWTAVAGGTNTKKLMQASMTASKYSPLSVGNVEYVFNDYWVDDFGNQYGTSGKLVGQDFINMFAGYEGPTATLNIYAQYTANYIYTFTNNEIDNVANGSHSESHIVDSNTGYSYTFSTPADIPERYSFLYWDGGDYGQFTEGSILEISAGNLGGDLTIDFIATYEYTPISKVKVVYKINNEIIYETQPSTEPINVYTNAPTLTNGQWLFETCPCVGEEAVPNVLNPIITTVKIEDEPVIKTVTVYGVLNGTDGKDGVDGVNGQDGKDGLNGKDGLDGKDGLNGQDGKNGVDGINGKDGIDGKDGEKGDKGDPGIAGKDGVDGKDGKDGINGKDGQDGAQGERGPAGANGTNGVDGITTIQYAQVPSFSAPVIATTPTTPTATPVEITTTPVETTQTSTRSNVTTETIQDEKVALSSGLNQISNWGLLNLICMIISMIAVLIPIIFRKKNVENYNKIIIAFFAIAAVIVFVLTENILLPMAFVDHWTWLMVIISIFSIILVITSYFTKKEIV